MGIKELEITANGIREDIIAMLLEAGSGHSAGPLGLADVYATLYFSVLHHNPKKPDWPERDILVTSNGHTAPVRYAAMARAGYFDRKELMTLRKFGSRLQGHPERTKLPGLETTSGPLGSGLSQAAGMALALRMDGQSKRHVFCVMGDGELDEGNVWEAAMFIGKEQLANLTVIIDRNNIQIDGPTEQVMPLENLADKWKANNFDVLTIDGNDMQAILDACATARTSSRPTVIIAHTIPGKGVDFMENDFHWHGKPPARDEAKKAMHELRTLGGKIRSEHQ